MHKKNKNPKNLCFHSLKAHQIGGGMCKRKKTKLLIMVTWN
jgi:hypothetical protein